MEDITVIICLTNSMFQYLKEAEIRGGVCVCVCWMWLWIAVMPPAPRCFGRAIGSKGSMFALRSDEIEMG